MRIPSQGTEVNPSATSTPIDLDTKPPYCPNPWKYLGQKNEAEGPDLKLIITGCGRTYCPSCRVKMLVKLGQRMVRVMAERLAADPTMSLWVAAITDDECDRLQRRLRDKERAPTWGSIPTGPDTRILVWVGWADPGGEGRQVAGGLRTTLEEVLGAHEPGPGRRLKKSADLREPKGNGESYGTKRVMGLPTGEAAVKVVEVAEKYADFDARAELNAKGELCGLRLPTKQALVWFLVEAELTLSPELQEWSDKRDRRPDPPLNPEQRRRWEELRAQGMAEWEAVLREASPQDAAWDDAR